MNLKIGSDDFINLRISHSMKNAASMYAHTKMGYGFCKLLWRNCCINLFQDSVPISKKYFRYSNLFAKYIISQLIFCE